MRVGIVTAQFEGLTRSAGIGTAYRRLAELLISQGHDVEVVFMPVDIQIGRSAAREAWQRKLPALRRKGFKIRIPSARGMKRLHGELGRLLGRSQCVFLHLRERAFDVVHAPDNFGLVYVALKAKRSCTSLENTEFVIGTHGPRLWHESPKGPPTAAAVLMSKLDQESLELADRVVSPSRYMVRYLESIGWKLPARTQVIPNVNALAGRGPGRRCARMSGQRPIVFFGRLEARKGIFLFSRALKILLELDPGLGSPRPIEVYFLGARSEQGTSALIRLKRELRLLAPRVRARFLTDFSSEQSGRFLKSLKGALVCMPSLLENSPYTIVECLESGLDFLATDSGGQAELLKREDRLKNLCAPDPASLSRALLRRLRSSPSLSRPSGRAARANLAWIKLHRELDRVR